MKFTSEAERLKHPLAKKISRLLWELVFKSQITEEQMACMQTGISTLLAQPSTALLQPHQSHLEAEWCCIMLGNPEATDDDLIEIANRLKLTSGTHLKLAAAMGCLSLVEKILNKASSDVLKVDDYAAFRWAAENGHLSILEHLEEKAPTLVEDMIKVDHYGAFHRAARNGHLPILEHFVQKASALAKDMIEAWAFPGGKYAAFHGAAENGHLAVLEYLERNAPTFIEDMIKTDNYGPFRGAAENGHLAVLEHLEQKAPTLVEGMIQARKYEAFRLAAENGHLAVFENLVQKTPKHVEKMIEAKKYGAFRLAARGGHLAVLKSLERKAPRLVRDMIKAVGYEAFRSAAQNAHLPVLEYLEQKAPNLVENMIKAESYSAFHRAAENGYLGILEHLEQKAPKLVNDMIRASGYLTNYAAFRKAARNGHLAVLEHLEQKAPTLIEDMIKAFSYIAFREAAGNGHLAVLEHLEQKAPSLVENMIEAGNYAAFREAAKNGHVVVLEYLERKAPTLVADMVKTDNYVALRKAAENHHAMVVSYLLPYANCFAYAEAHQAEYRSYVYPFVATKLTELKVKSSQLTNQNPNAVFDLTDNNEIKLCFYLLRNIIRRHDRTLDDDIYFLLQIPAVKAVAHVAVTPNESNELIRLALTTGNIEAAAVLFNIPAVRTLAEQHDFYRRESRGELDLHALARDRESSMRALTIGEQQRLESLTTVYQPMIEQAGVEQLINALREQLKERYETHSAMIDIEENGLIQKIRLPFTWKAFQTLTFTSQTRQHALQAYYQNKNHSAWRYLLKPNPWMHPHASYVYTDDARTQRWSSFEEYQPLIVLLWLAATDANRPPTDNHTLEGRLDHFIDELSLIARAHNWDQTRQNEQCKLEEYDDLEGDKPSCYSGVKRRLFQSLLGHPLLTILTVDIIDQELRDFVRTHFKEKLDELTEQEKIELRDIYQEAAILLEEKDFIPLRAFDISPQKQQHFIAALKEKYGAALNENPDFQQRIMSLLVLQEKEYPHLVIWGERVGIATIFPAEKTTNISMTP